MNWVYARWLASPVAAALGWAVIHSLWQCAAIAAALAVALRGLRSSRSRYAAACAAMLSMAGAFVVTLALNLPFGGAAHHPPVRPVFPPWADVSGAAANPASPAWTDLLPTLAALWMAGALAVYLYQGAAWISSRQLLRRGVCAPAASWRIKLDTLRERLGLKRAVQLLESSLVDVPVVLGYIKPVILIPAGLLAGLPAAHIEAILLHELAHVRRFDYLANLLQRAVEGLLFYHPAVWWTSAVIRREREHCCDDIAVNAMGDRHSYASALAALEESRVRLEPALAATGGNLMTRIRRLLAPERPAPTWTPLYAAAAFIAAASLAFAWQPQSPAGPAASAESSSPYVKWLNEDVVYIIADDERAAFLKLGTDEERQHFIEQFWARRNPVPGSPENKFKEEHYRRIAYANQRFKTGAGRIGWQTDRGRMYIVYGPPDEIETHPSGDRRIPNPYEEWLYRHVEGVGDNVITLFIDKSKTGDYRITPRPR